MFLNILTAIKVQNRNILGYEKLSTVMHQIIQEICILLIKNCLLKDYIVGETTHDYRIRQIHL